MQLIRPVLVLLCLLACTRSSLNFDLKTTEVVININGLKIESKEKIHSIFITGDVIIKNLKKNNSYFSIRSIKLKLNDKECEGPYFDVPYSVITDTVLVDSVKGYQVSLYWSIPDSVEQWSKIEFYLQE